MRNVKLSLKVNLKIEQTIYLLSIVIHIVKAENDNKEICPEYLIQSLSNESGLVNILSNLFFLY